MALEPLTFDVITQLFYISVGIVLLGLLLNWILGLKPELMKELRNKAQNLQERLRQAQLLGDQQLMMQLQRETMLLMKQMLKKQIAPMAIRCAIFLGIYAIISFHYGIYEYWFWIYFLFTLILSLLVFGIRKGYKKLTGKESKKEKFTKDLMGTLGPIQEDKLSSLNTQTGKKENNSKDTSETSNNETVVDSWKNKIKN